ncbi:hypothetical protein IWQ62_000248 [Dispira parvispora]|uniref:Uncharacterized protein n=1 Tax=Dispira parvispora TaxID=1520584 RepID=A0A9W8EAD0_9FUNG|nr:hypothetical protein IWQ62_000248 [Dispira parvispora]
MYPPTSSRSFNNSQDSGSRGRPPNRGRGERGRGTYYSRGPHDSTPRDHYQSHSGPTYRRFAQHERSSSSRPPPGPTTALGGGPLAGANPVSTNEGGRPATASPRGSSRGHRSGAPVRRDRLLTATVPTLTPSTGPFSPPPRSPPVDASKAHLNILRKHNEETALKQEMHQLLNQAHATTPGTYVGEMSKSNNLLIPVLPRIPKPS